MSTKSVNTDYYRNCPKCNDVVYYNNTSALNLAVRENKVCRRCAKVGIKLKKSHPETVEKTCEQCSISFEVGWKYRKQRFCSTKCMHSWRTETAWTTINCNHCGNSFKQRKKENKMFCSIPCSLASEYRKEKLREWGNSSNNHWNNPEVQEKVRQTKLERYGDENYNNTDKNMETMLNKYGVPYAVYLPHVRSNGKTISSGQRRLYEYMKSKYNDAELEFYLNDVNRSVDIFIPSENKIVEFFGDYWHCNPIIYSEDFYHDQVHKTAKEIWEFDFKRITEFKNNGYVVDVVWESDLKKYIS
jgi:G:T-mismatch repair DNA endonuclease (very short patch repair protein)